MPPEPFTFGEPEVTYFAPEDRESVLEVLIWYKAASGQNKWTNLTIRNNAARSHAEALEDALRWTTDFVRNRWTLVEVITPTRPSLLYGYSVSFPEGGLRRLRVVRSAEPITTRDTCYVATQRGQHEIPDTQ